MSKRKPMAKREPSGRTQRVWLDRHRELQLPPASETRRLRDLALAGVRPAEYGTHLGRLWGEEKITALQFSAGKRWATLVAEYAEACQAPRAPRTANLDPSGGTGADPDTEKGRKEARRHARTVESYRKASEALRLAGGQSERVVRSVCEEDQAHCGWIELEALKQGLQTLAAWWAVKGAARQKPKVSERPEPLAIETQAKRQAKTQVAETQVVETQKPR